MFARSIALATAGAVRARGLRPSFERYGPWRVKVWRGGRADGEPWLLLHGMGATSATYLPLLGALRSDCRIVAPELSANGGTGGPRAALGVATATEIVLELLEREFPRERPTICGVSLGGWIAVRVAARRPDLVGRLVLVVPGGYRDQDWRRIESMVRVERPRDIDAMWRAMFVRPPWFLRLGRPFLYLLYRTPTVRDVLSTVREEDAFDDADLARLDLPVAVIWGEHDRLFEREIGERMTRALPHARFTLIRDAGHAAQWEKPREFLAAVQSFRREFPLRDGLGRAHHPDHPE